MGRWLDGGIVGGMNGGTHRQLDRELGGGMNKGIGWRDE